MSAKRAAFAPSLKTSPTAVNNATTRLPITYYTNTEFPMKPASSRPGGGRVLGSAASGRRSLSPAVAIAGSGRLSPSASSVSLNSDFGSLRDGDGLRVGSPAATSTGDLLVCPICSEEMVTLLQLNRHLDDIHREVQEIEKDDISTWFRKRMLKAKSFQPVAVLNQKFKGLDVFESNDTPPPTLPTPSPFASVEYRRASPEDRDPDLAVTRVHWQRTTFDDVCLDPVCQKPLGALNGTVNCRKCGKLFCEEHTMYQIKLSRSAQHEPVRGFWCRVCETCYKSRDGYNDHQGLARDHTKEFSEMRRKKVDRAYLEVTRLEKRLTKLTHLLVSPPMGDGGNGGFIKAVSSLRNQRRTLEQSVVAWEEDSAVVICPYCKQTFSQFGLKRHHCRLCGRVVCGDLRTGCSSEVGLNVSAVTANTLSEKTLNEMSLDVRICQECKSTVFTKRDFAADIARRPADVRAYQSLVQFEQGIKNMMPRFQKLLTSLQDPHKQPTSALLLEATKTRKKLLDTFSQYDATSKRLLSLPSTSPTQQRLQKAVHQSSSQFLHLNMLPLKALPKLLKQKSTSPSRSIGNALGNNAANGVNKPSSSRALMMVTSERAASDAREKELKEQLMVLEEQRFLVSEMLADANKRRRFDEVAALAASLEELDGEVGRVEGEITEFESGDT